VAKKYFMSELIYKEESYIIIGKCMDVHNELGHGFSEIVYKDALEMEFNISDILFEREKEYSVFYKRELLKHKFFADFVVFDKIILEIKCLKAITDEHVSQAINYLKVSDNKLALIVNFARGKLEYQRILY
jgi:GxxExxY protein